MKKNAKKYGVMIIAAVLLVAMAFAGAASAETKEIWTIDDWKTNMTGSNDCVLMDNLDFTNQPVNCATITNFAGTLDGNYHTISNFSISGSKHTGLIGFYKGTKISNLTLSNFSVSGSKNVGGLVGCAGDCVSNVFENIRVEFGNVSVGSSGHVGGVIGNLDYTHLKNCTAESCVVVASGSNCVGGLVGYAYFTNFDICKVVNCSMSSSGNSVGGLVGQASSPYDSPFINGSCVTNCIVSAGSGNVGGLAGYAGNAARNGSTGCVVEKCTIVSTGSNYVGGLVGKANSATCVFNAGNKLKWCAISGNDVDTVDEVVGYDNGSKRNLEYYSLSGNVSCDETTIWLNNDSNAQAYPRIIIAKSADTAKQGPEVSSYFNNGQFGEPSVSTAKIVTRLTGYGVGGQYEAVAYVYESAAENQLVNTSVVNGKVYATDAADLTVPITEATVCYTTVHLVAVNSTVGYHFVDWDVTNNKLDEKIVVDAEDNFTMPDAEVDISAIFAVNKTNVTASSGIATFGGDNYTALKNPSNGIVAKVLLEDVSNVTNTAVNFTADNPSVSLPSVSEYNKEDIAVFEINATADGTAKINVTVTFADAATANAKKGYVRFYHYAASGWEQLTISATEQNGADVLYTVETTSFSPFGLGIYTPITYTPSSSSKQTGSTVILSEGQVAPTASATVAPTVAPTAEPTLATPTVIATEKPTTQATQQSPAPFLGIIAGLGAAAVLLRLRK